MLWQIKMNRALAEAEAEAARIIEWIVRIRLAVQYASQSLE
jgi:hypothetical protein